MTSADDNFGDEKTSLSRKNISSYNYPDRLKDDIATADKISVYKMSSNQSHKKQK